MLRRRFLQSLGATSVLLPAGRAAGNVPDRARARELLEPWIAENDHQIASLLARQQRQAGHPFQGGFPDQHAIYHPGAAASATATLMAGFLSAQSAYDHTAQVATALDLAIDYLLRVQHPDGTIDLVATNFHSPPDTAFAVARLAPALSALRGCRKTGLGAKIPGGSVSNRGILGQHPQRANPDHLPEFQARAATFLKHAGQALRVGGIHTPNHRWVVCMALAWIDKLFPDPALVARIDRWLLEGIDIDPDGQYTEKSVAVYSPIVDRSLITIARLLDRPSLFDPVRRNLAMTWYYLHANGELVTEASTRQDQYRVATAARYYYAYRYLSLLDQDRGFAAVARMIENKAGPRGLAANLITVIEDPTLARELPPAGSLPTRYRKDFRHSKLVRIRRGMTDATILADNPTFFTFFKGDAALEAVRLATAFFGKGQFASPVLRMDNGRYVLHQRLRGPYYQPFPKDRIPGDGKWENMPRSQRAQSEVQQLSTTITIAEDDGRFTIHFAVQGTDNVPLAIELAFREGGTLSGTRRLDEIPDAYLLEEGDGRYERNGQVITFGPGLVRHRWTQLRGAAPKMAAQCVYLTGYTPLDFTLRIQ